MDPAARRTTWELLQELRADGVTVVLTTHYMEEAERLADRIHIIDHGRLIAVGSPLELTRGGGSATIRLVVTEPYPPSAPASLQRRARPAGRGDADRRLSILLTGPADSSTLGVVSRWCEEQRVLPESLNLGQRNLEDVFLELTGRGLADEPRPATAPSPRPGAAPFARQVVAPRPAWRRGCCCATANSCCSRW